MLNQNVENKQIFTVFLTYVGCCCILFDKLDLNVLKGVSIMIPLSIRSSLI